MIYVNRKSNYPEYGLKFNSVPVNERFIKISNRLQTFKIET